MALATRWSSGTTHGIDVPFIGYALFLDDPAASGFTIASRTSLDNPFSEATSSDAAIAANPLIDAQSIDLGYTYDSVTLAAARNYDLMQLTIDSPELLTAGPYSIRVAESSVLTDGDFNDVSYANALASYTINVVVPEPAAALLALPCAAGLMARRRRRKS